MERFILFLALLFSPNSLIGQVDYSEISLDYGEFKVGFYDTTIIDRTRSYNSLDQLSSESPRPIYVSVWHPLSEVKGERRLRVNDYLKVVQKEEEWPKLPFEYFFDWFYIQNTEVNRKNANYEVQAFDNSKCSRSDNPIIIYSASYQASSVENFILAEYYASHGYTFISVPSRGGSNTRLEGGNLNDVYAQSRDVDFITNSLTQLGIDDERDIYLSGFSFGGISHIINGAKNKNIKGIISLDGTVKYRPELLEMSFEYDVEDFTLPFIHFSQKDIPLHLLKRDNIDTLINTSFDFYDHSSSSIKYQIKSKVLTHKYFSSFGLLFNERDEEQDFGYESIVRAHENLVVTSMHFLKGLDEYHKEDTWKHDEVALNIDTSMFDVIDYEISLQQPKDVYYLLNLNVEEDYSGLDELYNQLVLQDGEVKLAEGDLNTIGLQFIFSKESYSKGVNVLKFAINLYPNSANLHDSLAEGYFFQGDKQLALHHFEKSLALNPGNTNAIKRINEMKRK
jgi:tetratricopeptide (TPR) repeat protein